MKCINCGHAIHKLSPSKREWLRKLDHNYRHRSNGIKCHCGCIEPIAVEEKGLFTRRQLVIKKKRLIKDEKEKIN